VNEKTKLTFLKKKRTTSIEIKEHKDLNVSNLEIALRMMEKVQNRVLENSNRSQSTVSSSTPHGDLGVTQSNAYSKSNNGTDKELL
jgi:hypothetical protein